MKSSFTFFFLLLIFCFAACKPKSTSPASTPPAKVAAEETLSDEFISLMNAGKNYLDRGEGTNAVATYQKAAAIRASDVDLRLNLANAYLVDGRAEEAAREAEEALKLDYNFAAAHFVKGCAELRLGKFEEAAKSFENTKRIDPSEPATLFQLGQARMGLKQWNEAVGAFKEGLALDPNRLHAPVHYLLAQALIKAGRQEEANQELAQHQNNLEGGPAANAASFERSKFTQARVAFKLNQPQKNGIKVSFKDATKEMLADAEKYSGPIGIIDLKHNDWNSLFVLEKGQGFRLLLNSNGVFRAHGTALPAIADANYSKMVTGDLQNDRTEDIIVLGDKGSHLFRFSTNGVATEQSGNLLSATDGLLIDLDFTGKLDLISVGAKTNSISVLRQFGALQFRDITATSGIPATLQNAHAVAMADWNRDQNMDLIVGRKEGAPLILEKQRGGKLVAREVTNWVAGAVFGAGDFDNDLRPDLAISHNGKITICFNGGVRKEFSASGAIRKLVAIDYDNDGWLDIFALGEKLRAWRNLGLAGFEEETTTLRLDQLNAVSEIRFADFDGDCDSDAVVALANGGLRILRNEGGNANSQVKVQLVGNRSNASGLGARVEIQTGNLRLVRTIEQLPVEIGVGEYRKLDSFIVHWFNWPQGEAEVLFDCKQTILALELTIQEGSCPYVYAWDGKQFQFVTDILGAAPLGLPVAEGRYIESDPEELVWIGDEKTFAPRNGAYEVQITEELREALYLDEAKLVVVDHAPGVEVHSTEKLLAGKPFPKGEIVTLHNAQKLLRAETLEGRDVTAALVSVDGKRVSPAKLLGPQLRGLAEPHGVILDFGTLDSTKPLALVLNGWLRFGGGMANIAASHDSSLPFPFPILETEVAGEWRKFDVTVGAPAGKTKSIVVDLEGKLPPGARRLRLTQAFEIHWDRIALLEKQTSSTTRVTTISPSVADLHFRGFSKIKNLPADSPLTPDYEAVSPNSYWTIIPGGWCTRYGDVSEMIANRDEGLAILNSGDELTLKFLESSLPPKPAGAIREFFLYTDGWDKDSDFHVAAGDRVEPLPFHGMDDQLYGVQPRPKYHSDALHQKYNTRWVDSRALKQTASR